jgi:hypothetical protein
MDNASRLAGHWWVPALGIVMVVAVACGGDDNGGPTAPPQSDTTLTASLDGGTTFTATAAGITASAGRLLVIASNGPNESFGLGFELRTGAQASGPGGTATASYVQLGTGSWTAGPNIPTSSGTLTLTTATATHVVGTFSFTLVTIAGSTPATRQVTSGRIDIRY